ncbi:MAG TPA: response regulator [Vicinamibacterales bacterium]|nr:response regulator [Vicinamibacterales bacterium]
MTLRNLSIKRKLMVITMATSSLALLVASAGFLLYDLTAFRARMSDDLVTQAEILGTSSIGPLAFQDERAVADILAALRAKDDTVAAAIYAPDGKLFAAYRRQDAAGYVLPPGPEADGVRVDHDEHLKVFQTIRLQGELLGTLHIASDMRQWHARLTRYTGIVAVLMLGAAFVAFVLSSRLQTVISEPILALERTMRSVSTQKNFAVRARKANDDEVGALIEGFNAMLAEIQQRDAALQGANEDLKTRTQELEQEVGERLRAQEELKVLNATLEQRVAERSAAAEQRSLELARSQEALENQTRILQSILDSMSDGVIVADEEGRFILVNPAAEDILRVRLADAPMGEWASRFGFFLPDMLTPYPTDAFPLVQAIRGQAVEAADVYVSHAGAPDGIWISLNATPLKDEAGVLHNGVAVFRDITVHKRAEEQLLKAKEAAEAANRAKSQFLANMSHELRTPLNAIIGYSEMLQEQAEELEQRESIGDLQKIHAAGKHLQSLIDDILDLSKIEAGKMELFVENFDVAGMIDDVVITIQPLVEKSGNTLRTRYSDALGVMRSDLTKVRQILFNLLSNACKFTRDAAVSLEASRQLDGGREWVQISVSDTGIGMSEEQVERLFQDFTQGDASTTRKYGGTGLGLAISRRFCEMMDGHISVQSALGKGSTFTLRIPATTEASAAGAAQSSRITAPARTLPSARPPVLVIDDDPLVHDLMSRVLAKEGFDAVCAGSGPEGLALARSLRPIAITLDVVMPGMDGWAVLTALKADPELAEIPVVIVTMTDDRHMGYALGAADYVSKPVDPARLAGVLRRHASARTAASVLIVDDDEATREATRRLLKRDGWNVDVAGNGRQALDRLRVSHPSVILLDLLMPEMDGFDFLGVVRGSDAWRRIPVVVVTARDLDEEDRARLNGSVTRVLRKSGCRRDELLQEVRQHVRGCVSQPAAAG